jgi:hypothetical protein
LKVSVSGSTMVVVIDGRRVAHVSIMMELCNWRIIGDSRVVGSGRMMTGWQ